MNRLLPSLALAALAVGLGWGSLASAASQWDGWYGGVAAGLGKENLTATVWDDGTLTSRRVENQGLAYKALVGYHFNPYLAVEVSFAHFQDSRFTANEPNTDSTFWQQGAVSSEARAKGVGLTGVAAWPFLKGRFALLAEGGWYFWDTTLISRPTVAGGTLALGNEQYLHDDGVSWLYGAGVEMRLAQRWHVRLEWEQTTVAFNGAFANNRDRGVAFPNLGVTLDF